MNDPGFGVKTADRENMGIQNFSHTSMHTGHRRLGIQGCSQLTADFAQRENVIAALRCSIPSPIPLPVANGQGSAVGDSSQPIQLLAAKSVSLRAVSTQTADG